MPNDMFLQELGIANTCGKNTKNENQEGHTSTESLKSFAEGV